MFNLNPKKTTPMKKKFLILTASLSLTACGWQKIGTLTMASNRNVDNKTNYVLIERYVTAKVKNKGKEIIESAIDEAVKKTPNGEYMANVKFYIKNNGKKIKVEGDVWGLPTPPAAPTSTVK